MDKSKYEKRGEQKKFATALLVATGLIFIVCILIAVITEVLKGPQLIVSLCISLATAFGPIAIVTLFARVGFDAIFYEAAVNSIEDAIDDERKNLDRFRKDLSVQLRLCQDHSQQLIDNTATLSVLRKCGVVDAFEHRAAAYERIKSWLRDRNNTEFVFVGTSFRGLYWQGEGDSEIYELIKERARENIKLLNNSDSLFLRFIFTHPAFAYLREQSEGNERPDNFFRIREEILRSVLMLREIGIPEKAIKFFKGTPTLFGLMTDNNMFLNPYPYKKQAYTSFGFIVGNTNTLSAQFSLYRTFRIAHFDGVWRDTKNTVSWHDDKLEEFWKSTIASVIPENLDKAMPTELLTAITKIQEQKNQRKIAEQKNPADAE